jgi:CubicO group peptidase (beta-lactamase class C family)
MRSTSGSDSSPMPRSAGAGMKALARRAPKPALFEPWGTIVRSPTTKARKPLAALQVEVQPEEVGFDGKRLARLDGHFARYVDAGLLPGWLILVSRGDRIVHLSTNGRRDVEADLPVELDTRFRIFSMTKPVTSVAAMMLYEEGAFQLKDPVSKYIPSFEDLRVYRSGSALAPETWQATEPVRIWHLLTHTAGLTYGFHHAHPVDSMYRAAGFEWTIPPGMDLAACCDAWAGIPLLFQPGSEWNYSVASDVLGRVVEVASGQSLDRFFAERIFRPLGMNDTAFWISDDASAKNLAALYVPQPGTRRAMRYDALGDVALRPPGALLGGQGLVSTAADYHRFTRMLLGGGALEGTRLLGTRTLRYMTRNHLPGNADLEAFGRPLFSETTFDGVGFGLGFSVVIDPVANKVPSSVGEFAWGGAASTAFWVDPVERITAIFLTQLMPSSTHPLRPELRQLVYQALVDD